MRQFEVEDDLAELVWQLARPKPFENLTFGAALRRILSTESATRLRDPAIDAAKPHSVSAHLWQKKAQSPSPEQWAAKVPELRDMKNLSSWQAICSSLKVEVGGDSARRKLRSWVSTNRPNWPPVPTIDGDA